MGAKYLQLVFCFCLKWHFDTKSWFANFVFIHIKFFRISVMMNIQFYMFYYIWYEFDFRKKTNPFALREVMWTWTYLMKAKRNFDWKFCLKLTHNLLSKHTKGKGVGVVDDSSLVLLVVTRIRTWTVFKSILKCLLAAFSMSKAPP